jgi:hypothetical protein
VNGKGKGNRNGKNGASMAVREEEEDGEVQGDYRRTSSTPYFFTVLIIPL